VRARRRKTEDACLGRLPYFGRITREDRRQKTEDGRQKTEDERAVTEPVEVTENG
jgi:hypothetical protein